jgi:uncharacterized protein (TIGR03067 family)
MLMTRFAILGLLLACPLTALADDKKDTSPLQGSWKVVEASRDGKPAPRDMFPDLTFTFDGGKISVQEGKRPKPDVASFTADAKKAPAQLDMVDADGNKVACIYKIDKDGKLTIVFGKNRDATRPKGFDDKDGVVLVLEKLKQ